MAVPGNAYPAVQLDARGDVVDSGVVVQFTDSTDQPGSGGGSVPVTTNAGSPVNVVTPSGIGAVVIDTTNGGLYQAVGVTSADWVAVGGNTDQATSGVWTDIADGTKLFQPGGASVTLSSGEARLGVGADGQVVTLEGPEGAGVVVADDGASHTALGFFGATPVAQPAAPVLLSDVISALQALGLVAS